MIGKTLFLYFFRRFLTTVGWYLLAIMTLTIVIDYSQVSTRFGGLPGFSNALAFQISLFKAPSILLQIVPFIGLFASMTILIQLNRKYELVIARAAGLSAWQFLFPVAAGAFLLGLASVFVVNPIAAKTYAIAEEMQAGMLNKKTGASAALIVPWLRQNTDDGAIIIGAKAALKNGTVLSAPVFIILSKDGLVTKRIDAAQAVLANRQWRIRDVVETAADSTRTEKPSLIIPTTLTPELIQERLQQPETIPFFELPSKIAVARALGYPAYGFSMQFHSLLALPALLIVMTLIAATVTLKFVRFGQSAQMILGGILAGFVLYVVTVLVKAFGGAGIVPPAVAAWLPVVVAFLFGVSFILHTEDG